MDIVFFGQQDWDVCWTAKQQLTTRLARRGHRILYVNPMPRREASLNDRLRQALLPARDRSGLREIQLNLWVFTDQPLERISPNLNARRRFHVLRAVARRGLGMGAPVSIVSIPTQGWLQEAVRPAARIYYAVDEWTGFGGLDDERKQRLRRQEDDLLRKSDLALAVSPRLLERFLRIQPRSYLQENAADFDHFSPAHLAEAPPHPRVANLARPRLGFVGQVDDRVDQDLLRYLARARPGWAIVLAGRVKDGVDVSSLKAEPNIHFLGYQPYEELPGVLREFDACLVPYRLSELTQSCNPLKVYEYLATGLPVVSRPLEGLNSCRDAVALAAGPEEFLGAVEMAVAAPAEGRDRRLAVAAADTWDRRVDLLEERIEEALRAAAGRRLPGRGTLPARRAARYRFPLDAKDAAQYQRYDGFADKRLSALQRLAFEAFRAAGWGYYGLRLAGRVLQGDTAPSVRRILVVRRAFLGDFVTFLPTLQALRQRFPDARIVLGVQPGMAAAALLEGSGLIDEILPLDFMERAARLERLKGALSLFARGFDFVVTGASYYLLREALFSGAPRRLGLYDGHPWQSMAGRALPLDPNRHETDNNLALLPDLDAALPSERSVPALPLSAAAAADAARRVCESVGLPDEAPLVLVHPGGNRASRYWPAERFGALIGGLLDKHPEFHVVLTGSGKEKLLAAEVCAALPAAVRGRVHDAAGLTDLRSLVGLLDRSAAVICNDTGVMHLARARGRPLLALLGPENDRRWGPYPLGKAPAVAIRHVVPCAPCVRSGCEGHYCMRSLSVQQALDAAEDLLARDFSRQNGRLYPLERIKRHHSWRDIAEAGHDLPAVAAVVFADGAGPGLPDEVRAGLARQDYPRWSVVVVETDPSDPGQAWRDALEKTDADLLVPVRPDRPWPVERLSADVAALQRSPWAVAAAAPRVHTAASFAQLDDPWLASLTVRRAALSERWAKRNGTR